MVPIYEGRPTLLQAPTGTGKTLAYLLPLLQRLMDRRGFAPSQSGPRILIVVPSGDLQVQTAALARSLLGPRLAESVVSMRRDVDHSRIHGLVLIATPRQVMELLDNPLTHRAWLGALTGIDALVVDEADRLLCKFDRAKRSIRFHQGLQEPCVKLLDVIVNQKRRKPGVAPLQLVAATATLNRATSRKLRFSVDEAVEFVQVEGVPVPEGHWDQDVQNGTLAAELLAKRKDPSSSTRFPAGLRHTLRVVQPFVFAKVIDAAVQTLRELQAARTLVIIATDGKHVFSSDFGQSAVTAQLRFRLAENGVEVNSCSSAVQSASDNWSAGPRPRGPDQPPEVIVATNFAVRGIHLSDIDAVVILGDTGSPAEYIHCAGRTCRYEVGREPTGGAVVSIVPEKTANELVLYGLLNGFKILEVPMRARHPPAPSADPSDSEDLYADFEDAGRVRSGLADIAAQVPGSGRRLSQRDLEASIDGERDPDSDLDEEGSAL